MRIQTRALLEEVSSSVQRSKLWREQVVVFSVVQDDKVLAVELVVRPFSSAQLGSMLTLMCLKVGFRGRSDLAEQLWSRGGLGEELVAMVVLDSVLLLLGLADCRRVAFRAIG